jgi:hypothetical protein
VDALYPRLGMFTTHQHRANIIQRLLDTMPHIDQYVVMCFLVETTMVVQFSGAFVINVQIVSFYYATTDWMLAAP